MAGIMIVGAETVIDTMTEKEMQNVLAAMTQGVAGDLVPGRENVPEIMIVTGSHFI